MITLSTILYHLTAATQSAPQTDLVSALVTAAVSGAVFSAIIGGLVQLLTNRRNSRIIERKNTADSESDLVRQYKEAASEERAAKESAVRTIKELLSDSKEQIAALKATVDTLTNTIRLMESLAISQNGVIEQLTEDRDRTQAALVRAETRVEEQKEQLRLKEEEIQALFERAEASTKESSL